MKTSPKPIRNSGIQTWEFRKDGLAGDSLRALYASIQGITKRMILPKIPAVKLRAVCIWFLKTKLTNRMRPSRTSENVRVALETLLGSMEGKKILKTF
jgi:hypothetical protein